MRRIAAVRRCWPALLLLCIAPAFAQENLEGARDDMGRGVKLFQAGRYPEAAKLFEKATQLAPTNLEAKLYLGICYVAQFHAGSPAPENLEFARRAEDQFMAILRAEPADDTALSYMANLQFERSIGISDPVEKRKQLERAREWFEELEDLVPRNKEAPFTLAVIDWQQAHDQWMAARARAGMPPDKPGPVADVAARAMLQAKCVPLWDNSVAQLRRALEIDPDFENAMVYMGMVLRERADMAADLPSYQRAIDEAQQWNARALEARQRKGGGTPSEQ